MDITASMIRSYKSCPKKFFFEYAEGLKPEVVSEPLEIGRNYHECLESLLTTGEKPVVTDLPSAMAEAFDRYIPWRNWEVKAVEKEYRVGLGAGIYLKGKIDALCADGTPIEHKSSSVKGDEKYRERLFLDDQVSCYLLALTLMRGEPVSRIVYTVCQKPQLRPSSKIADPEENARELLERQRAWFDEEKVTSFTVVRSAAEISEFQDEVIYLARSIRARSHFYRNPDACRIMGCAYQPICQDYDPECLAGFVKKERTSEELCKF